MLSVQKNPVEIGFDANNFYFRFYWDVCAAAFLLRSSGKFTFRKEGLRSTMFILKADMTYVLPQLFSLTISESRMSKQLFSISLGNHLYWLFLILIYRYIISLSNHNAPIIELTAFRLLVAIVIFVFRQISYQISIFFYWFIIQQRIELQDMTSSQS